MNLIRCAVAFPAFLSLLVGCANSARTASDALHAGGLSRIAFGSCARSDRDQPIWDSIVASRPELFVFAGDNMYADLDRVPRFGADIRAKYSELAAKPGWQQLNDACPVRATWDDHDYGLNDAGAEWHLKDESQAAFLDFFDVPTDSPRRQRAGVYHSEVFGPIGRRVQLILLDTRYHRSDLTPDLSRRALGYGPYVANDYGDGTMLGEEQWAWLETQLRQPADLRLVVSSVQVVPDEHGWEGWYTMPHERERLYELIGATHASGVIFLSGDRHLAEISMNPACGAGYPIWDFTSSGFNWGSKDVQEPNRFRRGGVYRVPNFGIISIEWDRDDPLVTLEARHGNGSTLIEQQIALSTLR